MPKLVFYFPAHPSIEQPLMQSLFSSLFRYKSVSQEVFFLFLFTRLLLLLQDYFSTVIMLRCENKSGGWHCYFLLTAYLESRKREQKTGEERNEKTLGGCMHLCLYTHKPIYLSPLELSRTFVDSIPHISKCFYMCTETLIWSKLVLWYLPPPPPTTTFFFVLCINVLLLKDLKL